MSAWAWTASANSVAVCNKALPESTLPLPWVRPISAELQPLKNVVVGSGNSRKNCARWCRVFPRKCCFLHLDFTDYYGAYPYSKLLYV